ncbi:cytidine/deoxycytidylate deaminase family protein [Spongorhabdus nitratireducens]
MTDEFLIGQLLNVGKELNPAWPFAACIVSADGTPLVTAANATHISPLFTAEGLAIHMLASEYSIKPGADLTLYTTAEPEALGMAALYWSIVCNNIPLNGIVYGATREDCWGFCGQKDIALGCTDMLERFHNIPEIDVTGPMLRERCKKVFTTARQEAAETGEPPLSLDMEDFYIIGDWMPDEDDNELSED